MMIRLVFCVALAAGAIATPVTITAREGILPLKCTNEGQDVKNYFGLQNLKEIKWDYVTKAAELDDVLKNQNHMIVIDVTNDGTKNVISDEYTLDAFLETLVAKIKEGTIKKGVIYNVKSVAAFKAFMYTSSSPRAAIELPPFPQWFHINLVKSGGQNDPTVIDVSTIYEPAKTAFDCYTFSFGWGANDKCASLSKGEITEMSNKVKQFTMLNKNLVIDVAHLPDDKDFEKQFNSFTFIMDDKTAKCSSPKTLNKDIEDLKTKYGDNLLMDETSKIDYLETHKKICDQIKPFIETFQPGTNDLTGLTWKHVTSDKDLSETVKEDIIKVDADETFLGPTFKDFISKFAENQNGKGLVLNLRTKQAVDAYWNIILTDAELKKTMPISIQLNIADFSYNTNKWIDCYTPAFGIKSSDTKAYTTKEIEDLTTAAVSVKSDEKLFALDIIKVSKNDADEITELIKAAKHALVLSSDKDTIDDVKSIRNILIKNLAKTFIDAKPAMIEKISAPAKMSELIPEINTDRTVLEFVTVSTLQELKDELNKKHNMIQVDIDGGEITVEQCIEEMSKNNDNGIKMRFTKEATFEKAAPLLKYRNFPIWIHLVVDDLDLANLKNDLTLLRHQIVLGPGISADFNIVAQKRKQIPELAVTIAAKAAEYVQQKSQIDKMLGVKDDLLIWMTDKDTVVSKELRTKLDTQNYYLDIPNKLIIEDCPKNQKMDDFSKITISKYVGNENELKANLEIFSMIRGKIIIDSGKVYIHDKKFSLDTFLSTFEKQAGSKKKGIIFTIESTDAFDIIAKDEKIRKLNYPIWLDVNIYKTGTPANPPPTAIINLNYIKNNDIIDCRTLSLGLEVTDPFTKYNADDIKNLQSFTDGGAKVYTIRAEFLENNWNEVRKLIEGANNEENKILSLLPETKAQNFKSKEYRAFVEGHKNKIVSDFPGHEEKLLDCPKNQDVKTFFDIKEDFSKLLISGYVKTKAELNEKIDGNYHLIRAQITKDFLGVLKVGSLSLNEFLEEFEAKTVNKKKGIIFTITTTEIFSKAMTKKMKTLNYPIWFDVNIYKAGTPANPPPTPIVDLKYNTNNDIIDCRTLSLGLEVTDPFTKYNADDIKNLQSFTDGGAKVYTIRAEFLENNWNEVRKLIEGANNEKNKILSLLPEAKAQDFKSKEYRTFVKDHKTEIVSDFPGHEEKLLDCPTNQDVGSFFKISDDLSKMLMSGFVKDQVDLLEKLDGPLHMIRAEVSKDAVKGLYVGNVALTLEKFLAKFVGKTKGIIFTFKDQDILNEAMVKSMKTLNNPIWYEFEALDTTTLSPIITPNHKASNDILDCRTMLLKMKIDKDFTKYEIKHTAELKKLITYGVDNKFSFRAEYLKESWDTLEPLLNDKSIFVYRPEDSTDRFITKNLRDTLRDVKNKIFVDLEGSMKHALKECPANNDFRKYFKDVKDISTDLSVLRISDPIKSIKEAMDAIKDNKQHVLSFEVKLNADNVPIISDGVELITLLKAAENIDDQSFGAKITFTSQKAFDESLNSDAILDLLRNINRPVWINALVVANDKEEILNLNYERNNDLLDCRTLSLGWAGEGMAKYSEKKVEEMQGLDLGENPKIYVVELLHIAHVWDDVKDLVATESKNVLTLLSKAEDADKVDYPAMEDILTANKNIMLYDFPDVVRKSLTDGCGSLSSNLLLASLVAFIVMIFN